MDKLKRILFAALESARNALPRHFFVQWALPAAVGMLLAYGAPFGYALFFGSDAPDLPVVSIAFAGAVWCAFGLPACLTSLMGLFAGSAASGEYAGCAAAVLFAASVTALRAFHPKKLRAIMKYGALFAAYFLSFPVLAAIGLSGFSFGGMLAHFCAASLCTVLAFIFNTGLAALRYRGSRSKPCSELAPAALALLVGLIGAAFGFARVFSLNLGAAFIGFFCLVAARSCGISSIALAAVAASGRTFALGADISSIAVFCLCTLASLLLRPLGKWGVLAGFSACSLGLYGFMSGRSAFSPSELLLAAALFMIADISLDAGHALRESSLRETELLMELERRDRRLNMLSEVLGEMARLFGGAEDGASLFVNAQLSGVAGSLARLASPAAERGERFSIGIGTAECPGLGSEQTGDTACIRDLDGMSLAAISDGMGTGEAARRESEQTVNMVADLVACGFNIADAAELVNRLLLIREGGESYATLDAMLFDRTRGSVVAAKHGAPASYIIRRGRLNELCAEALPVGIVEEAKTAVFSAKIRRGDVIIMMSDGVSDALGDALCGAVREAAGIADPKAAARELVESARRMGGEDDMTAIVARVG